MVHISVFRVLALGGVLLSQLILSACSPGIPIIGFCTNIGCIDVLDIKLEGTIPDRYTIEIISRDGRSAVVTCSRSSSHQNDHEIPSPFLGRTHLVPGIGEGATAVRTPELIYSLCTSDGVSFTGFTPDNLGVVVSWYDTGINVSARPKYRESRPNGPGCDPVCRTGEIVIHLPVIPTTTYPPPIETTKYPIYPFPVDPYP